MGRNAQPIDILTKTGKKHLTKAEKENRKQAEAELKLGGDKLTCPMYVKGDPVAYKKWQDLIHDYNKAKALGMEIIKSSDAGILARYCKTHSEYRHLLTAYQRVSEIHYNCDDLDEAIDGTYYDEESDKDKALFSYKVKKQLRDLFAVSGILSIEAAINKKMDMLIKMEDRLFLNPLAKIKNIPKKEAPKENPLADQGYGNV